VSARFVPISPDTLQRHDLHAAALQLYYFLVDQQTSADGVVFYGKAVGYAWIQSRYLRGSLRSLKRHMRALKDAGFVEVRREFHGGMRIRLPRSVKFAKADPPPAVQLSLYAPEPTPIRGGKPVDKPVENLLESCEYPENHRATDGPMVGPRMAPERSKEPIKEKITTAAKAHVVPRLWKTEKDLDARRRLLLEQAEAIKDKYKSAG
jgi:hypothetical protein